LKELEAAGVRLLVCGTCADYFDLKKQIGVGNISNMYDIMSSFTPGAHVIYP
jgi:hypothetical protein